MAAATPAHASAASFEVDAESTVIATLYALAQNGRIHQAVVQKAIKELGVDAEKTYPQTI